MSVKPIPRVRAPTNARKDEIVEIKTLISHPMESGQRRDAQGQAIARRIIRSFEAKFNGKTFFQADWQPAISANPYQAFFFKASVSGEFHFAWTDDDGSIYEAKSRLTVA